MISGALEPEFWGIGMAFAENRLSDRSGGALLDSGDVERINFLRVFLVLSLVLLHFGPLYGFDAAVPLKDMNGPKATIAYLVVSSIGIFSLAAVPTLSVISGFLFFRKASRRILPDLSGKILRRTRTLLLPFVLWSGGFLLLAFGAFLYDGAFRDIFAPADGNLFRSIGNAWLALADYPFTMQLWFVRDLILTVLLSPVIWLCVAHRPVVTLGLLAVLWLAEQNLWIFIKLDVVGFFTLGAAIAVNRWRREMPPVWVGPVLVLFLTFVAARTAAPLLLLGVDERALNVLTCILRLAGVIAVWNVAPLAMTATTRAITRRVSHLAFFVHCAHFPTILAVKAVVGKIITPAGSFAHLCVYVLTVTLTLASVLLAAVMMRAIAPTVFSILSGGRMASEGEAPPVRERDGAGHLTFAKGTS